MSERIQKVLARAGVGSRRAVERWIAEGRVRVNGKTAEAGAALTEGDRVEVEGRRYHVVTTGGREPRWLRYHKPEGQVCTRDDPEGRPTVFAQLPRLREAGGRWVSLGRLDVNTTGLMLFTDDGTVANALTHPSAGIEREYAVRVRGAVDAATIERMTRGILLDDGEARFDRVVDAGGQGTNHWYHVVLHEGRRNEVRRIWEAVGCQVARLTRVRFGPIELPRRLRAGRFEDLPPPEAAQLNALAGRGGGGRVLALEPFRGRTAGVEEDGGSQEEGGGAQARAAARPRRGRPGARPRQGRG
ncbi:MAG: pseudouridine synthase [Halofilum sp. (in: g-proteobacteria)]|nr:pseudouridine synthase [Halofilum sp. (in: g-proteobacteria)]